MADIIQKIENISEKLNDNVIKSAEKFQNIIKPQYRFFAIDLADAKSKIKKEDPIVVTIGVNYGQNDSENKKICINRDSIIKIMRNNLDEFLNLQKGSFHLIMTNLSPWITNISWAELKQKELFKSRKDDFLNQALELGYIHELKKLLKDFKSVTWVGHTKSIWPELENFMHTELKLKNFYLTFNLAYPWYVWHKKITFKDK